MMTSRAPQPSPSADEPVARTPVRGTLLACLSIAAAAFATYHNSFSVPFVYDDQTAIPENLTLHHLGSLQEVLSPPAGLSVSGRPLVNFSLAVSYALSGSAVWGYHAVNLAIHGLAGLALFGLVRRTLLRPGLVGRYGKDSLGLALAVALLWTVHPLQTESVTYIIQRAESLMGLFYLLTLYGFVRGVESPRPWLWQSLTVGACLLGMATKEVMVSAPLIVLLYDRTFVAGTFHAAWRQRPRLYLGLSSTWILLGILVAATGGNRNGSIGFGSEVSWWAHGLTQFQAVTHYLRLAFWPHPLVFDYDPVWVTGVGQVLPHALMVIALAIFTLQGVWRGSALGFLGMAFFSILAPTSLMPAAMQLVVEHRMYLPLAAVLIPVVLMVYRGLGRRSLGGFVLVVLALGVLTARRNEDYRSELAIWSDTVAKQPQSVLAQTILGTTLLEADRIPEAMERFNIALRLKPDFGELQNNLGDALARTGRLTEALEHFDEALRLQPDNAPAHNNLGSALLRLDRPAEAAAHFERAIRLRPGLTNAHTNLAGALAQLGRIPEAITQYEAALQLEPGEAATHYNYGITLVQLNRLPEGIVQYEAALRLQPDSARIHNNLAIALVRSNRLTEALGHFQAALRLEPDSPQNHTNLGTLLAQLGRAPEAMAQYEAALRLQPGFEPAKTLLAQLRAERPGN